VEVVEEGTQNIACQSTPQSTILRTTSHLSSTATNMKSFGTFSAALTAALLFASSVYGQLDPIVIKVHSGAAPEAASAKTIDSSGLQILLQDQWH
jgi:hypothetical protein